MPPRQSPQQPGTPRRRPGPVMPNSWIWLVILATLVVGMVAFSGLGGGAPIDYSDFLKLIANKQVAKVVIAGKNARVERSLTAAAERLDYPVRALRFIENVYDYMHAADALVTKPGGLTTAEALVARVPMVLCKPLPGQEERNARILGAAGAALRTRRVAELPGAIETVLTDEARRHALIAAATRLARPNAAGDAAAMIARLVKVRKEVVA